MKGLDDYLRGKWGSIHVKEGCENTLVYNRTTLRRWKYAALKRKLRWWGFPLDWGQIDRKRGEFKRGGHNTAKVWKKWYQGWLTERKYELLWQDPKVERTWVAGCVTKFSDWDTNSLIFNHNRDTMVWSESSKHLGCASRLHSSQSMLNLNHPLTSRESLQPDQRAAFHSDYSCLYAWKVSPSKCG